ncbi:hypothetical protein Vi05172_g3515 [Venturia inaequalis]|nr:hypothetical protein Vi05172_g3515 [Venturia inaequalis]
MLRMPPPAQARGPSALARSLPQTPRPTPQREPPSLASSLKKLSQCSTTELYPRLSLYAALTGFKDTPKRRAKSTDAVCDARREFLDSFAYLCDVKKGGATVTAAALQKLPMSNILWLAANEGISEDIEKYARNIRSKLCTINVQNEKKIHDEIFQLAVKKCAPRIRFYRDELKRYATRCRMTLKQQAQDEIVKTLRSKLKKLSDQPAQNVTADRGLINLCYDMRDSEICHINNKSNGPESDFSKLAHFIWRLGATRCAVNRVVEGALKDPSLQLISDIRTIKAPETARITTEARFLSPHEVLHSIVNDSVMHNPLHDKDVFDRLCQLDVPRSRPIHTEMAKRTTVVTRVHAELQIADRFSRSKDMKFVGDDRFIGCSKPACYFCSAWLCEHKKDYVSPGTHRKVIPGCRGPDNDLNEAGAQVLLDLYRKIVRRVGQDIYQFLQESHQPRRHFMSTEAPSETSLANS